VKQTCNSPWKFSNNVSHSTCTFRGRVNSRLLMIESQIVNLTSSLYFYHNLCCRCPNGSCEAIYTSIGFQWYKKNLKARCFDPCNRTLKLWKSWKTPKSPFWECECHPHILPKVGLQQKQVGNHYKISILNKNMTSHFKKIQDKKILN
jgi:hypothetical protein